MTKPLPLRDAITVGILCATDPITPEKVVDWVLKFTDFKDYIVYAEILRMIQENVIKSTTTLELS
jgi:hypothetical protein